MSNVKNTHTITVFCGAKYGNNPAVFKTAAELLGQSIAKNGWELVIGGGRFGMMGSVTAAALEAGISKVHAISTQEIWAEESDPKFVSNLTGEVRDYTKHFLPFLAPNIEARKQALMVKGDVLCIAPGATGSFDEFFDFLMRIKQGRIAPRPIIVANIDGYYEPFKKMIDDIFNEGYEDASFKKFIKFVDSPKKVIPVAQRMLEECDFSRFPKSASDVCALPKGFRNEKDKYVIEGKGGFEFYYKMFSSLCLMKTGLAPRKPMVIVNKNHNNDNVVKMLQNMAVLEFEKHSAMRHIGVVDDISKVNVAAEKIRIRGNNEKPSAVYEVAKLLDSQNAR